MKNSNYAIVQLCEDDMSIMLDFAAKEGWNPGLYDASSFYHADPKGFFAGKLNGEIIAVGSGVNYQRSFAFFGLYIVKPEYRGHGYGMALTRAIFQSLEGVNVGLDGVVDMQAQYAQFGFKLAHRNTRYCGVVRHENQEDRHIVDLSTLPLNTVVGYDNRYFPADRQAFLRSWLTQPESRALGYVLHGQLLGYGVIRRCIKGYKIGPLFAESAEIAEILFLSLSAYAQNEPVSIDIIDDNHNALALVTAYSLMSIFPSARMYNQKKPDINIQNVYGITSLELG